MGVGITGTPSGSESSLTTRKASGSSGALQMRRRSVCLVRTSMLPPIVQPLRHAALLTFFPLVRSVRIGWCNEQ